MKQKMAIVDESIVDSGIGHLIALIDMADKWSEWNARALRHRDDNWGIGKRQLSRIAGIYRVHFLVADYAQKVWVRGSNRS